MSKRVIISLAAIAMMLGTSTLANAQANPAGGTQSQSAEGHGQKLKQALAQLDLSPKQKAEIKAIMADVRSKMQALKSSAAGGTVDKAQAREIMKSAMQKIVGVLTPDQKAKLKEILKADKASGTTKP